MHLIVKNLLVRIEASPLGVHWPTKYFSAVATCANVWRSQGAPNMITEFISRTYGAVVAATVCKKVPGKCLRGRWLAIDTIEGILTRGHPYLQNVFRALFAVSVIGAAANAAAFGLGAEEDEAWRESWETIETMLRFSWATPVSNS